MGNIGRRLQVGDYSSFWTRFSLNSRMAGIIYRLVLQTKLLWLADDGKDTVEYGLLMVLVSLAALTALLMLVRAIGIGQATSSSQSTTSS